MLFGAAHRDDQRAVAAQQLLDLGRSQFLETPGAIVSRIGAVLAAMFILAAGEWLGSPGWFPAGTALVVFVLLLVVTRSPGEWRVSAVIGSGLVALAGILLVQTRLTGLAGDREAIVSHRVADADEEVRRQQAELAQAAELLADSALKLASRDRLAAFETLERLIAGKPGLTVTLLEDRRPVVWAGPTGWADPDRWRTLPPADTTTVVRSPYYLTLEARRHLGHASAIVSYLLWADEVTGAETLSLAGSFSARTGIALIPGRGMPPGLEAVSPDDGAARRKVAVQGRALVSWAVVAFTVLGAVAVSRPAWRYLLLAALLALFVRTPIGAGLGAEQLFSPATFFRSIAGPFSSSVGLLAVSGTMLTLVSVGLWRLKLPRRWFGVVLGVAALVVAPDVYREVGRGITPPAGGVSLALWITWQLAMVVTAAGLISLAAALFRGQGEPADSWKWWLVAGVGLALVATLVGTYIWRPIPRVGWPMWYTALWWIPLLLVTRPAPRWATAGAIAVVAAAAASLVTWGAVREGSLAVALRDIERLGLEPDPLAVRSLELLADRVAGDSGPATAGDLYRVWHRSDLADEGHPAVLALWRDDGSQLATVALDSLAVPEDTVAELVRNLAPEIRDTVLVLPAVPGVHYLLLARVPSGVASVTIGPRTRLLGQTRLGWLLSDTPDETALYDISQTAPVPMSESASSGSISWRRTGWTVSGEADISYREGVSRVQATVDLRGPLPVWTRGALLVALDIALLLALWGIGELLAGGQLRLPDWSRVRRSFRLRLTVALAGFFVLPAVGFATWGFVRLASEARQERDAVTTRIARDGASLIAGSGGDRADRSAAEIGADLDVELWLYRRGVLADATSSVLDQLGITPRMVPSRVYRQIGVGPAVEAIAPTILGARGVRVNYRTGVRSEAEALSVVAVPQLQNAGDLAQRRRDLAYLLLLATLLGLGAAIFAARWVALALSRPVADLRRSAIAIGQGQLMPAAEAKPPLEFEPVFGAFARMAVDIRDSQEALEEARRRTAAVLATVPIGVVAIDGAGKVVLANAGAESITGTSLPPGCDFADQLGPEWKALADTVAASADDASELTVGDRRLALRLARMGEELPGLVLALSDITEASRAERVLAWGEMARQVAHEIKNPLTPMRLGMQHLKRVYRNRPQQFGSDWDETSARILSEIDRLDRIARAFSRFGSPGEGEASAPLEPVDLKSAAAEVVQLYGAGGGAAVALSGDQTARGMARLDEVKEVLLNLIENARQAGAATVTVKVSGSAMEVSDDGPGIPAEDLPRVFEPHFSTTSSGSGLGLAIVRRLVASWDAEVRLDSVPGEGTTVRVEFVKPSADQ